MRGPPGKSAFEKIPLALALTIFPKSFASSLSSFAVYNHANDSGDRGQMALPDGNMRVTKSGQLAVLFASLCEARKLHAKALSRKRFRLPKIIVVR